MRFDIRRCLAVAFIAGTAGGVHCGTSSVAECLEGSDFIANAAHARDHGMPRETFLARLDDDLLLIRAFPPQLRWFAKDADDERFLVRAAQQVFDRPVAAEAHRALFLDACFARSAV